jgi:hypothetical protein
MTDIQFYLALSVIYFAFGIAWGVLCYRHLSELLYVALSSPFLYHSYNPYPLCLDSLERRGGIGLTGHGDMPVIACSSVQFYYYLNTPLTFYQRCRLCPPFPLFSPPSPLPLSSRYRATANTQPNAILHIRNNSIPNNRNDSSIRLLPLYKQTRRWNFIPNLFIRHRNSICR